MPVVRTKSIPSLGTYMPASSHPHTHPHLRWQVGSLLPPPAAGALPQEPAPHPTRSLSPALLAQVSKLDTALVALKAAGQELLLELEKNQ